MHEIIAKIARLAVSKAAAFFYAVAVGVAANLAFNFVQQHHSAMAVATAPPEAAASADSAMPAALPAVIAPTALPADATPTPVAPPAAPLKPAAPQRAWAAPPLPQPPAAITLPSLASLPAPALKPTALPPLPSPSPPAGDGRVGVEAALRPAATGDAALAVPSQVPPPAAALPSLGPAIEVAAPPTPPAATVSPPPGPEALPPVAAARPAASEGPPGSLELSDVWHPYRAVKKGLHWAGEQVPLIGGDDAAPQARAAAPSAPISLLPPAAKPAEKADALVAPPKPAAPGPGSGGLY